MHSHTNIFRFISFAFFSYFEKALIFTLPLVALYTSSDKETYNRIEYAFAASGIISIFLDCGLKTYLTYAYRNSKAPDAVIERIRSAFTLLIRFYILIGVALLTGVALYNSERFYDFLSIAARTIFLSFIAFLAVWFRLKDSPSEVFKLSVPTYLVGALLLWVFSGKGDMALVMGIVLPHVIVVSIIVTYQWGGVGATAHDLTMYLSAATRYGWPVLLSIAISMGIGNAGRIYAYENLSTEEMFNFSFAQRMALIVQLAHASALGFLSKRLFISDSTSFHTKAFIGYICVIILSSGTAFAAILIAASPWVLLVQKVDSIHALILFYTVCWCIGSYLEVYLNRMNKNIYILRAAIFSGMAFIFFLTIFDFQIILKIVLAMIFSSLAYIAFVAYSIYRMRESL